MLQQSLHGSATAVSLYRAVAQQRFISREQSALLTQEGLGASFMELPQFQRPVLSSTELLHSQLHFCGPDANQKERPELKRGGEGEKLEHSSREIQLVMAAPLAAPSQMGGIIPLICRHWLI